jgi:hypothetical protein
MDKTHLYKCDVYVFSKYVLELDFASINDLRFFTSSKNDTNVVLYYLKGPCTFKMPQCEIFDSSDFQDIYTININLGFKFLCELGII